MLKIAVISTFGVSVLAIIYSLILVKGIFSLPTGSKKLADAFKVLSAETKDSYKQKIKDFFLIAIVLFTAIMYAFGWQSAVCFLALAVILPLIDSYLMNFSLGAALRSAEATRSNLGSLFKINYNIGLASSLVSISTAVIIFLTVKLILPGISTLVVLGLAAILSAIFSWRSSRATISSAVIVLLSLTYVFNQEYLSGNELASVLPISLLVLSLFAAVFGSVFAKFFAKKERNLLGQYLEVGVFSLIMLAGFYFGVKYFAVDTVFASLQMSIALAVGLILAVMSLFFHKFSKIIPAIIIGLLIMAANFLVGTFAISLVATGFLALAVVAIAYNIQLLNVKNSGALAANAEFSDESIALIEHIAVKNIKTKNFLVASTGILALGFFAYFALKMKNLGLDLSNQRIIIGLVFGAAAAYLASSEAFSNKLALSAFAILAVVATSIILGPVYLAGAIAGSLVINLLVSQSVNSEILAVTMIAALLTTITQPQFNLTIRASVAGAIVLICVIYFLIKKFYGRDRKISG